MAALVHDGHVPARHRHGRRAELDRQDAEAHRIGDDRPAGFGLPPVIDHRHAEHLLGPGDRVGVGPLAGQEQGVHRGDVVVLEQRGLRVLLAHGAEGGRRGEEGGDLVVLDHPPEGAGVRRADRLAFVEHGGAAVQQRRVDDVGMADHPADVGGGPVRIAGLDVVNGRHRPLERDRDSRRCRAPRPSARPSCPRCREYRAGRSRRDRRTARACPRPSRRRPGSSSRGRAAPHPRLDLRPLEDDAGLGLVLREPDREVEQGLVFHDAAGLDAAARGQDDLRLGVVDAGGQLLGGEAAEHHRMHRADARAGQHRHDRFGDHRHVDQDTVARLDAEVLQHGGERRRLVQEFAVAQRPLRSGDRAIVIERRLVRPAAFHVAVERVVAGVDAGVGEPAAVDSRVRVEDSLRRADPGDLLGGFRPKRLRIGAPLVIGLPVTAHSFRSLVPAMRARLEFSRRARVNATAAR